MSIPLDRLYDHLYHKSNHDMLIYGWKPHGSKKLADFTSFRPLYEDADFLSKPVIFFHDQEPLCYNMYSQDELYQELLQRCPTYSENKLRYMSTLNLRCLTTPVGGLNDQVLIAHSEKYSKDLDQYVQNNFIGVYFWSHALIAADWFRYAEHDPLLNLQIESIQHDFLIYNRAWSGTREYRLAFANALCQHHLHHKCLTAFSAYDNGVYYKSHVFKNQDFDVDFVDLENILLTNTHNSTSSADYNNLDYKSCGIEIVLETLFDDQRWHLTEKSLRPIACGSPFILMSTPGSLEYLRDYGFETFSSCIDESYDRIQDPCKRMQAVITEMQRISCLPLHTKQQLWEELYIIARRNKQLFFSTEWHNQIENEFFNNIDSAIELLAQGSKGQIRSQILKLNLDS